MVSGLCEVIEVHPQCFVLRWTSVFTANHTTWPGTHYLVARAEA